jgi:hypothetical protein
VDLVRAASSGQVPGSHETGELLILGSGLAHYDLMIADEAEILRADRVFHCLYDRVTHVWLRALRPDAIDLKILYDTGTDRFVTYVRMAEVILHCLRRGEKVVALYYGHPGIFATPAHRAMQIAKSEGHRAKMRPGISALDYLIADVGFDPMLPGLLSFDASDLLLRRRTIDASLHLVIWQVGMVGEQGFAPGGFKNPGLEILAELLQDCYGADWELVHYIAPQYAGVEPLIERLAIGSLRDEHVRRRILFSSTFYVEPMTAVATDGARSRALGYTREGEAVPPPTRTPEIASYGGFERAAVETMRDFRPPSHYRAPTETPAAAFMLALSRDPELQDRYRANPEEVLDEPRFAEMTERARKLLAIPHPLAIDAALKEPARDRHAAT